MSLLKLPFPSNSQIDWELLFKNIKQFITYPPIEPPIGQIYNCVSGVTYPVRDTSFLFKNNIDSENMETSI